MSTPGTLDREKARAVVLECIETTPDASMSKSERLLRLGGILDALEACVVPAPQHEHDWQNRVGGGSLCRSCNLWQDKRVVPARLEAGS